jgi:hypothetical protein
MPVIVQTTEATTIRIRNLGKYHAVIKKYHDTKYYLSYMYEIA